MASGLNAATAMQFAPDGRLFVAEQGGQVRVIKDRALLTTPFLTLDVDDSGERGLLGVAFDPSFATNRYVYVFYTAKIPAVHNRISRFTAAGDVVDPAVSEVVLLDFDTLSGASNHNGGALHFGPDGMLYAAHGDNAMSGHAQTLTNLFGKIIRMHPIPDPTTQIPVDNPFAATATGKNRLIWALGLRNPFTFSVQPGTGVTYVNDVGENLWEEINLAQAGRNFGWPTTEGPFDPAAHPQFTPPAFTYRHDAGTPTGCAITGGTFYDPAVPTFPALYLGKYFFSDFCSGWIYHLDPAQPTTVTRFASDVTYPVDLKVGPDGALYYLARVTGSVGKIVASVEGLPQITQQPTPQTVNFAGTGTFTVVATGAPPLTYQWLKNEVPVGGATASSYTTPPVALVDHNSTYRCLVTNGAGTVATNAAPLAVLDNVAPWTTILTPVVGSRYSGGSAIAFSGGATDPEDGTLAPSRLSWRIDFHHDTHVHPAMPQTSGMASGSFTIPTTGETSANVWYRVYLTATDSAGFAVTSYVDVLPNTTTMTVTTSPPGLTALLDGQPVATPRTVTGVVGMVRTLGVVSPQTAGGRPYQFFSWSDGGAASHTVVMPAGQATFVATYAAPPAAPLNLRVVP